MATKKEERDVEEEDEEFSKEIFIERVVEFEKIMVWIERVCMLCIIICYFPYCFQFAAETLSASNLVFAVFFIVRLILCSSALGFNHLFFKEQIAFLFSVLIYYFEYSRYLEIAAAIFVVTNGIEIVNNWPCIKKQVLEKLSGDASNLEESDNESEDGEPKKTKQPILQEADAELSDELQKTNDIGSEESMMLKEEQAKDEEKAKSYIEEEDNHIREAFLRYKKCIGDSKHCLKLEEENYKLTHTELRDELQKTSEIGSDNHNGEAFLHDKKCLGALLGDSKHCLKLEEENYTLTCSLYAATKSLDEHRVKWDEEKIDLSAKLDESIEMLRHYLREKKHLAAKLDDTVETMRHYKRIANDYHFKELRRREKETHSIWSELDAFNSSPSQFAASAANVANAATTANPSSQYNPSSINAAENVAINAANFHSDFYDPFPLMNLFVERNNLSAKLQSSKTSADFYKAFLNDSLSECRKLREENNNLSAKVSAETSSAEQCLKLVHESEEKCRNLEGEKNELVTQLYAAKAASQLYRSYLHDVGS